MRERSVLPNAVISTVSLSKENSKMTCTLERYLREQEVTCLRIAKSANDGTPAQTEWLKTAEVLHERRVQHILVCKTCSKDKVKQASK